MKKIFVVLFIALSFIVKAQTNKTVKIELEKVSNDTILPHKEYKIMPSKGYDKLSYVFSGCGVSFYKEKNFYYISCNDTGTVTIVALYKSKVLLPIKKFVVKK